MKIRTFEVAEGYGALNVFRYVTTRRRIAVTFHESHEVFERLLCYDCLFVDSASGVTVRKHDTGLAALSEIWAAPIIDVKVELTMNVAVDDVREGVDSTILCFTDSVGFVLGVIMNDHSRDVVHYVGEDGIFSGSHSGSLYYCLSNELSTRSCGVLSIFTNFY